MNDTPELEKRGNAWIPTTCDMCFSYCGVLVHRVNGVVTEVRGDPGNPYTRGKLCAKGHAALMGVYDPSRVTAPLIRRNSAKGIGVDAQWEEITWDEALDIMVDKLAAIKESDPRKLVISTFDIARLAGFRAWAAAFGTPNVNWMGYYCGNYLHASMYMTNGSFHSDFDLDYCNYCILLGNQHGFMVGLNPIGSAQKMAEARSRGMRLVVVDPIGTNAAAKADSWVSIRPGTDAALVLAMVNVLVNELKIYDRDFLKMRTNAPYLVGQDGLYVREPKTNKPMVWDSGKGQAIAFDELGGDPALEGSYVVEGCDCQPAFELLKAHVTSYSPEEVAKITSVPSTIIRQLATDFGEAAQIGSTIVVEGTEFPFRPVAMNIYRGAGAHKHGALTALAVQVLNMVVGAFYVPGGHRGVNLVGPSGSWLPGTCSDGLITPPPVLSHEVAAYYDFHIEPPQTLGLNELFPISTNRSPIYQLNIMNPGKYKLPYHPEVLIVCRRNLMMNNVNLKAGAQTLKNVPFVAVFATHLDEVAEFADLVLPEANSMERLDLFPNPIFFNVSPDSNCFYWNIRQPVLPPRGEARCWIDVLWELADRMGFLPDAYRVLNAELGLKGDYTLDPAKKYTWEEIFDRQAKSLFGPEHDLEWFKVHGCLSVPRKLEERYPGPFISPRFPIYFENLKRAGREIDSVTKKLGIDWDVTDYQPLPDWKACPAHKQDSNAYELFVTNRKLPFHNLSQTAQNPWLNELGEHDAYGYKILLNPQVAKAKGIRTNDQICLESTAGRIQGKAKVTECVHPEVLGIAGVFGSWAKGKPVALGKGAHFNSLLVFDEGQIDWVSSGVDCCAKVKLYKNSVRSR